MGSEMESAKGQRRTRRQTQLGAQQLGKRLRPRDHQRDPGVCAANVAFHQRHEG